jgi:DNA-binding SARP family transcriptional activator/tetratricopeptide (TPR) repeat protein
MSVKIALLGEVTAQVNQRSVDLGAPRQRCVLAALAVDAGRLVPAERLVARVWGADTPRRGRATLQTHISRLRGAFGDAVAIVHRSGGYTLAMAQPDQAVDLLQFRALRDQARSAGDDTHKVALLAEALALWHGEPLSGLSGEWVEGECDRWQQEHRAAEHDLVDAQLSIGLGDELVAPLSTRAAQHPLDERVAGQYMLALHRAGRSADAVEHYRQLREHLIEELGTDPGTALQDLHQQILAADPSLNSMPVGTTATLCALPAEVSDLAGREDELAGLRLEAVNGGSVVVVGGSPGVGKTTLAVSAAHRLRRQFPDGCFAVDLRGMDDQPAAAQAALDRLLRALGVPRSEVPASEIEQSNLFRMLLTNRRVLVLLDNAADEAQVRPLLAAVPGCLTLVTCRRTLAGLEGARWVWLDPLSDDDAIDLLATIVGPGRVAAEPEAAVELVELCGNLPLAVRIVGNRLATQPRWTLAYLAGQLHDERTRLSSLSAGDLQVRSAFEMSYRRLSASAQLVFRRLAALPGADFDAELAEVATGSPSVVYLVELVDASLLQVMSNPGRFQFHDLIRIFAGERLEVEETPDERDRLARAVLDHLLGTACTAARVFYPGTVEPNVFSHEEAAEWLDREQSNWKAAQREAARLGRHQGVLDLAKAMHWYSDSRWTQGGWEEIFELGVEAARALANRADEAKLLNFLGWARSCLGDYDTSYAIHRQALTIANDVDDRLEQAWALGYMGSALMRLGRLTEALSCVRQACVLASDFSFWTVQVGTRIRLGRVLQELGRDEEALSVNLAVLADVEIRRDETSNENRRWITSMVRMEIGRCLTKLRQWETAAETFGQARRAFAQSNVPSMEADAALHEGRAWREAGNYTRARTRLEQALASSGFTTHSKRQQVLTELTYLPEE